MRREEKRITMMTMMMSITFEVVVVSIVQAFAASLDACYGNGLFDR